jgi:hypothetical protein
VNEAPVDWPPVFALFKSSKIWIGGSGVAKRDGGAVPPSSGLLPKKPKLASSTSAGSLRPTSSASTSGSLSGE